MGKVYGYVRVSSKDQNEDRQIIAIKEAGIDEKNIFVDKISGKNFQRPTYIKMLKKLKRGDVLVIKSIDRLGRNYEEVVEQWRYLTKEKGVDAKVLDMPLLDTTRDKNLLGTLIADLVLQLLSYVAENERDNIRQRQAEGISAARVRGVKFGRRKKDLPENFEELYGDWLNGHINGETLADLCGMSRSTLFKLLKNYKRDKAEKLHPCLIGKLNVKEG